MAYKIFGAYGYICQMIKMIGLLSNANVAKNDILNIIIYSIIFLMHINAC